MLFVLKSSKQDSVFERTEQEKQATKNYAFDETVVLTETTVVIFQCKVHSPL